MQEYQEYYTEKEILADGLAAQKSATSLFNMSANECVHDNVRNTILKILNEEHVIQVDVFDMMHQRGFYETPAAEEKKVQDAKQKFAKSAQK